MVQIPEVVRELIANGGFPTKHLSYSSVKEYLGNPRSFLKKYIRYEFDDQTKAVFMVGRSVHKALEVFFEAYKIGEMMPIERIFPKQGEDETMSVHLAGIQFFHREILITRAKSLAKYIKENGGEFEFPIFNKDLSQEEVEDLHSEALVQAMQYIDNPEEIQDIEFSLLTLGSKTIKETIEESEEKIVLAIKNFFESEWAPEGDVHSTERESIVFFTDEYGEEMPIPVKAIIDRLDVVEEEINVDGTESGVTSRKYCIITDYKTVDKFSETDADKADYEMQAGTNYVTALVETGVAPKYMRFVEILKGIPPLGYAFDKEGEVPVAVTLKSDLLKIAESHQVALDTKIGRVYNPLSPDQKLLKADLEGLIEKNNLEIVLEEGEKLTVERMTNELINNGILVEELVVTNTIDEIRQELIEAGVLVRKPGVNVVEINFDERPDIMLTFFSMYKGIITMIALSEIFGVYLPNISAQWGGVESWKDFKEFEGTPRDTSPVIKILSDPVKAAQEIDDLDSVEGF